MSNVPFDIKSNLFDVAEDILYMKKTLLAADNEIVRLQFKAAIYKAYFFNKEDLVQRLETQLAENMGAVVGEFDGFCYSSARAKATFRDLDKMLEDALITEEEYNFCEV